MVICFQIDPNHRYIGTMKNPHQFMYPRGKVQIVVTFSTNMPLDYQCRGIVCECWHWCPPINQVANPSKLITQRGRQSSPKTSSSSSLIGTSSYFSFNHDDGTFETFIVLPLAKTKLQITVCCHGSSQRQSEIIRFETVSAG